MIKIKSGFTIGEIVVATLVFVFAFFALFLFTNSSRGETTKSINYLRAMQLAQETIDWINSTPFSEITDSNLAFLRGSLVDSSTMSSVIIPIGENAKNSNSEDLKYPEDYSHCYFFRTVKIEDISNIPNNRFLKKITVGIYWNEGKTPKKIETTSEKPDRMKKIILSTLVFNEKEYY